MKPSNSPFNWTIGVAALLAVALLAAEVILQVSGHGSDTLTANIWIPFTLLIGFIIGVPVNPSSSADPKA